MKCRYLALLLLSSVSILVVGCPGNNSPSSQFEAQDQALKKAGERVGFYFGRHAGMWRLQKV
jgi:hypothetical protein